MNWLFRSRLENSNSIKSDYNSFGGRIKKYQDLKIENITIIDVGANRGGFYDELISIFPNTKIKALLIEPLPGCIDILEKKFNGNKLVSICNKAVSDHTEPKEFFIYQFDETSSLLKIKNNIKELSDLNTSPSNVLSLITSTLDDIVKSFYSKKENIDILKIDVQGYEDKVLLGACEVLRNTKFIWIEVSFKALYDGTCLFNDIHTILSGSNFILVEISDGHRSPENELLQANCLYKNSSVI